MTRRDALRWVAAVGLLFLLDACAQRGGGPATAPSGSSDVTAPRPEGAGRLVLQVGYTGGFLPPGVAASRLPLVSVYADGRVITEGPVPEIHPPPALPNLQVEHIHLDEVEALVDQALTAGVGETTDLGMPPIADAPFTRFVLVTGSATYERQVYALFETSSPGHDPVEPGIEPWDTGLTPEQEAARAELWDLLDALTAQGQGDGRSAPESYDAEAVAAVVTPWTERQEPELVQEERPWPGPPLPGEVLDERLGIHCVTASGATAQAVLDAARSATALTPWVSADGRRWSLAFRPLLPHETGCADLSAS